MPESILTKCAVEAVIVRVMSVPCERPDPQSEVSDGAGAHLFC